MSKAIRLLALILMVGLAACSPATALRSISKGDELAYYDFSNTATFEEGNFKDGDVQLHIRDGLYQMKLVQGDGEVWYAQWGDSLGDVMIDVEAQQATDSTATYYGVMCRARGGVGQVAAPDPTLQAMAAESATAVSTITASDAATTAPTAVATLASTPEQKATAEAQPSADAVQDVAVAVTNNQNNGDGYLFLVRGDGSFGIFRARGRGLTPLVNWTTNPDIVVGAGQNNLRAVCVGDYLAFYINGKFMADASDDAYATGQIGMVAAAGSRSGLLVGFDNLTVSAAKASAK